MEGWSFTRLINHKNCSAFLEYLLLANINVLNGHPNTLLLDQKCIPSMNVLNVGTCLQTPALRHKFENGPIILIIKTLKRLVDCRAKSVAVSLWVNFGDGNHKS